METIANQTPQATRKRFTAEQRQELLNRFHQSGLTQKQFVAGEGISQAALGKWLQAQGRPVRKQAQAARFQEVMLPGVGPRWAIEVVSPQNWTLRLSQPAPAKVLQELLGSLPC